MNLREIAKRGLKGRKRDTLLISLVITLSFIFIITSIIFKSSTEKTKLEQSLDLYGEYHASYLEGDEEVLKKLEKEKDITSIGKSLIVGESEEVGVVGSFNKELLHMARFDLYKGEYPIEDNEIMLEINQMSKMGLDLEVGQEIKVSIDIPNNYRSLEKYIKTISKDLRDRGYNIYDDYEKFYEEYSKIKDKETKSEVEESDKYEKLWELSYDYETNNPLKSYKHHETPYEKIDDTTIISSNDYIHFYTYGEEVNPDIIREKGFIEDQKIILSKDFIVTGIIDTYTDKWTLNDFKASNSFITESAAKNMRNVLYTTELGDFSNIEMYYNIFLKSDSLGENLFDNLSSKYTSVKEYTDIGDSNNSDIFSHLVGAPDEAIEAYFGEFNEVIVERALDETQDKSLEGNVKSEISSSVDDSKFRRNYLVFGQTEDRSEYILSLTIIAIIFVFTALAIFQIFLTQMKRRSRKLVLLRSIGATKLQIIKMVFYEALYFLKNGLLIGVPIGFIFSFIIIYSMNRFGGRDLQFFIDPYLLLVGIIAGILSLFVGVIVPIVYAVNIPLVGTIKRPANRKKRDYSNKGKVKYQSFKRVNRTHLEKNRGKALLTFGICFIAITILLSSLFLMSRSFDDYKDIVLKNDRPSYVMEAPYGELSKNLVEMEKELLDFEEINSIESYKVGKGTMLWYKDIENNVILNDFENLLPLDYRKNYFSKYNSNLQEFDPFINEAFYTKLYGIEPEGDLFDKYKSMLTRGEIDPEKFKSGEEIILLTPIYTEGKRNNLEITRQDLLQNTNEDNRMNYVFNKTGLYDMTYQKRYAHFYKSQEDIKVGQTIRLSSDKERIEGNAYINAFQTQELKVGGIIDYFPQYGKWPFSNDDSNYIVISSMEGLGRVYPNSNHSMRNLSLENIKYMIETLYPTRYARTVLYIDTVSSNKDSVLNSKLLTFAHDRRYSLYNYNESNSKLYGESFNNALIIALLGLTATIISLLILYNIMGSKMEQDRNRIGILQSLGVTREKFKTTFLKMGAINASLSLILTHIILFMVLLIASSFSLKGIKMSFTEIVKDIFIYRLWLYPWWIHIILSLVYFIIVILIFYIPAKKIIDDSSINNIRSLRK